MDKDGNLQNGDPIFDSFMHRPFDEEIDGWRNELVKSSDLKCINDAREILEMFEMIRALQKENWYLRKQLERYKPKF